MEVLLVSTGVVQIPPETGGAVESYVWDLARILAHGDVRVSIVSDYRPVHEVRSQATIQFVPAHSPIDRFPLRPEVSALAHLFGGLSTSIAARRECGRRQDAGRPLPDVIHLNEEISGALTSRLVRGPPTVLSIHNPPPALSLSGIPPSERLFRSAGAMLTLRFSVPKVSKVIALSSAMRRFLIQQWALSPERVTVLPLPIDTDIFVPNPADSGGEGVPEITYVGRLDVRKDPLSLVEAVRGLQQPVRLTLIGSGPLLPTIRRYIRRHNLEQRVTVRSRVTINELISQYRRSTVLVLPSYLEVYPRVVIEAASCGVPVVLPESELYSDFLAASFVHPFGKSTGRDIVHAISDVVNDAALRHRLGDAGRRFAVESLGFQPYYRRLMAIYEEAINCAS